MQTQQSLEAGSVRESRGYLASFLGSLAAIPGFVLGWILGAVYVDTRGAAFSGSFESLGWLVMSGAMGFLTCGALGCWGALRRIQASRAGLTALILGGSVPLGYLLLLALDRVVAAEYLGIGIVGLPFLARALALRSSE